ncbi:MAG: thiol reductant ABC exporter subunit CydC [Acidimicrobiales bacterium]
MTARGRRSHGVFDVCRRSGRLSKAGVSVVLASGAMASLSGIGLMTTSGWLITRASLRPPVLSLAVAMAAVQAFALGRGVFRYVQRLSVHSVSLGALNNLRLKLFDDLEALVPGGLPDSGSGGVLNAFVGDTDLAAEGLAQGTTAGVDVAVSALAGSVVAALVLPVAGLVVLAGSLGGLAVSLVAFRRGAGYARKEAALRSEVSSSVVDTLRSARELTAFGREDILQRRLDAVGAKATSTALRRAVTSGIGAASTIWVSGAAVVALLVVTFAAQRSHHLSGVMVAVAVFSALATFEAVSALPAAASEIGSAGAAAQRLAGLAELPRPVHEPPSDLGMQPGRLGAKLDNATVRAADGTLMLPATSLAVRPGTKLGVTGPSGSGKTTALWALLHFVECDEGRATIGDHDVTCLTRADIARVVGWMSEDTHLFAASLADNLRLGNKQASDRQCREVLERVGLAEWFAGLPDGLDTQLGAGSGRAVSAGERQRLGLARALLAGGSVMILDEPTAHIDPATSGRVLAEMISAAGDQAIVVVSHEPQLALYVDEVVKIG